MAASRTAGLVVVVVGLLLLGLALLADPLGIGGGEGFGYQQMIVFIVGMAAVLFASTILLQSRNPGDN
jgi:low affinity Fe/Cu permease